MNEFSLFKYTIEFLLTFILMNTTLKLTILLKGAHILIKAIVLDIDGTLLNSDKQLTSLTKKALIEAQKKGIKVILASGRPTTGMFHLAKELKMDTYEGYIISYNGAKVTDAKTGEVIFNEALKIETAQAILEHLKQFEVLPMIDKDEYMYVNNVFSGMLDLPQGHFNVIEYEARGGNFLLAEKEDLAAFVDFELNKILVAAQPAYLQANHEQLAAPFKDTATSAFSAPFYYEFTAIGIDKAKALDTFLHELTIHSDEVIAFGDGHNDKSIIEYAGVGVAMGNAVDEIKEIAQEITKSNDEDGIAFMLEKYLS
jgi:Cof subfamily protein (haloacid dehalogenase superfamily)